MKEIIISNIIDDVFIDRIYQNFNKSLILINKDGSEYLGKIKTLKKKWY